MGRAKPGKPHRERTAVRETHEPAEPLPGWPRSHATTELTGDEQFECVRVTIHGVDHYLHATTARELHTMLGADLDAYNAKCLKAGVPTV